MKIIGVLLQCVNAIFFVAGMVAMMGFLIFLIPFWATAWTTGMVMDGIDRLSRRCR